MSRPAVLAGVLAALGSLAAADPGFDSRSRVAPGASGVVRTVVEGVTPVDIPLRVIGTFADVIGPGYDLYLVELTGEIGEHIGVAAGMSGSPVYVDGALVGALSYRLGALPRSAIGGVTPIEDVLRAGPAARPASAGSLDGGPRPIGTPISLGGLLPAVRAWIEPELEQLGFRPVAGGGTAPDAAAGAELAPGMPVAAMLVGGDLNIGSSGTVTYVDGPAVYAFGHPFFGLGSIEMPMARATVTHTLADELGSLRLTEIGAPIGALLEDRLTAVVGRTDRTARTTSVELTVEGEGYGAGAWSFRVVRHRRLGPLFTAVAVVNALGSHVGFEDAATIVGDVAIVGAGGRRIEAHLALSGEAGSHPAFAIAGRVQQMLAALAGNAYEPVEIESLEIQARVERGRREYTVESVLHPRRPLRSGATLEARVALRPRHGPPQQRNFTFELPASHATGPLTLAVGAESWVEARLGDTLAGRLASARSADAVARALGSWPAADRLIAVVYRKAPAVQRTGGTLRDVPPSAALLLHDHARGERALTLGSPIAIRSWTLDGPVSGGREVTLEP